MQLKQICCKWNCYIIYPYCYLPFSSKRIHASKLQWQAYTKTICFSKIFEVDTHTHIKLSKTFIVGALADAMAQTTDRLDRMFVIICIVESRNNPPPMNLGRNWHVRYVLLLHQVIPFCIILPHSPKWSDNKLLNLSGLNRICWEIWLQLLVWSREKAVVKNSNRRSHTTQE